MSNNSVYFYVSPSDSSHFINVLFQFIIDSEAIYKDEDDSS